MRLTGNRALTGFTAPKLLWMRKHEPENYDRIAHVLLPKDYVRLRLTGEHAIDVADASGTLLFDVARRAWCDEVLDALEIPREWLPARARVARGLGRDVDGVPVAAGAGDQAAGALGVGVDRPGPLSIALGTSGVVFAALAEFAADERARVHAFCHAVPGHVARDGRDALGRRLAGLAARRRRAGRGVRGAGAPRPRRGSPAARASMFLPYLAGERTPHADPDARGAFTGLCLRHDRGALVRAVLEGVAFGLRDSFDLIRELGVEPERGRVSGGGARSELWLKHRRLRARAAAGAPGRGGGRGVRRGAARRRRRRGLGRHRRGGARLRAHARRGGAGSRLEEAYAPVLERYRALYPALQSLNFRACRPGLAEYDS